MLKYFDLPAGNIGGGGIPFGGIPGYFKKQ